MNRASVAGGSRRSPARGPLGYFNSLQTPLALAASLTLVASLSPVAGAPESAAATTADALDPDPAAASQGAEALEIEAPRVVLHDIPFEITLRRPADASGEDGAPAERDEGSSLPFRLLTAGGRELTSGRLGAGEERALGGLRIGSGAELPLRLELGQEGRAGSRALDPPALPGWISLVPPLVAIALALLFREVVISLFLGVWAGAFFYAGMDPLAATWRAVDRFAVPALADADHATIIAFTLLLGGMVGVISRSGGTRGIVEAVRPVATTPRRSQFATYLAGLAIFFDDYANTLIVGNTMRPITDSMKVSREKLAYIVDSTAAPIAAIIFVSTWVGFEISLIGDGLQIAAGQEGVAPELAEGLLGANPFVVFLHTIPYLFYPILALVMVATVILLQRDFGPMWEAENRAGGGGGLFREGAVLMTDTTGEAMEPVEGAPPRWYNAAIPVLSVVFVVLFGLYFDGRGAVPPDASLWEIFGAADPFATLLWGSFTGCVLAIGLAVGQRILTPQGAIDAWVGGLRAMVLAVVILILAWSLQEVTDVLGTAPYLSGVLGEALPLFLLPVIVFLTSAAVAFATGTSWGTMAILLPIVIPLAVTMGGAIDFDGGANYSILLGTISSVLAGAILGDHCSPISDTTVMSSLGTACDHMDHVWTQLPYALLVGAIAMAVGDIPTALGVSPVFSYAVGIGLIVLVVRFAGRPIHAGPGMEETPR